jgi:hypothetical protein
MNSPLELIVNEMIWSSSNLSYEITNFVVPSAGSSLLTMTKASTFFAQQQELVLGRMVSVGMLWKNCGREATY